MELETKLSDIQGQVWDEGNQTTCVSLCVCTYVVLCLQVQHESHVLPVIGSLDHLRSLP